MEETINIINEAEEERKAFLSLQNLEKVYPNGEKAVYNFNLDINKNEFIVIVGPSGCGKSTTLRMLAGLEDISSGDIYMEDELLNYKACKDRRMAIVFQSYALYPQMNVYNNIAFPLTINKYPFPVVNAVLKTNDEIKKLLQRVTYKKLIDTLYEVEHSKRSRTAKEESVATIFAVTYETAKFLLTVFDNYKKTELEQLEGMEDEVVTAINAALEPLVAAEQEKINKKGIVLDDEFCELGKDGARKIVSRKMTPYEIKVKVFETADKLDLTPYIDKLPKELSGGQMQRVALGRAIVKNVPVFLMDEPLSNLDAKLRLTMRSEIVKIHNRINATTVYVTHDQTEAMTMATRIVVMSRGFVQQIGTPEEIYSKPVNIFVAKFIGSPAMNIFEMQLDRKGKCLRSGEFSIPVNAKFITAHNKFYAAKAEEYTQMCEEFDDKASEKIRKLLSITGEHSDNKQKQTEKHSIWHSLKRKKTVNRTVEHEFERTICERKRDELVNLPANNSLMVGIRPERLKIELYDPKKEYSEGFIVQPTVCELLGGEYSVHFDYCGKEMVGQISAESKVTTKDKVVVSFSADSIYVFDPITGEVIN